MSSVESWGGGKSNLFIGKVLERLVSLFIEIFEIGKRLKFISFNISNDDSS